MQPHSRVLALTCLAITFASAIAADESFAVRLSPAPRDAAMRQTIAGQGAARVTLRGRELTVEGTFAGFVSPATRAELRAGSAVGVRGPALHELTVSSGTSGTLHGAVTLDDAALAAFEAGRLYLQIASESAPDGNVWGWLLPAAAPIVSDR
jgi:hypothetical protein